MPKIIRLTLFSHCIYRNSQLVRLHARRCNMDLGAQSYEHGRTYAGQKVHALHGHQSYFLQRLFILLHPKRHIECRKLVSYLHDFWFLYQQFYFSPPMEHSLFKMRPQPVKTPDVNLLMMLPNSTCFTDIPEHQITIIGVLKVCHVCLNNVQTVCHYFLILGQSSGDGGYQHRRKHGCR